MVDGGAFALAEADAVLFMVDAELGATGGDWDLANRLRNNKVPVVIVANKVDNPDRMPQIHEFHAFGIGEVMGISAIHGVTVRIPAAVARQDVGRRVTNRWCGQE